MSETSPDLGPGSGKYRSLFELGQGGTANVWLAVARGPEGFSKLLVVKRLRAAYAQDPDLRAMFMTEARLSARLNHPHVVQVYEVLEHEATPTIAMEYIEGQTLESVLAQSEGRLPLELHLRVLADVLAGLHHAHELRGSKQEPLGVVHRDVSPHNVMVSYDGVVKVLDFGIAKLAGSSVETEAGVIKGKLRYMPPEQIAGEEVDRRADVFAVGVMLWEALSGTKLWQGLSDAAITRRVLSAEIPPPRHAARVIDPALEAICVKALAADRGRRFHTAQQLELAIDDYLAEGGRHASARDLGRFMGERFAAERAAIQERVELELDRCEPSRPPLASLSRHGLPHTRTGYTSSRSSPGEPPRSRLWLGALAFIVLGVVVLLIGLRDRQLAAVKPAAAPAVSVLVSIEARPAEAAITIDDVAVPNPYIGKHPRDATLRRVRVTAPGFVDGEAELAFDSDVRVFRALSPSAAGSWAPPLAPTAPPVRPSGMTRPAPRAASSPSPLCDPPYYLDARGIKKFKAECL